MGQSFSRLWKSLTLPSSSRFGLGTVETMPMSPCTEAMNGLRLCRWGFLSLQGFFFFFSRLNGAFRSLFPTVSCADLYR